MRLGKNDRQALTEMATGPTRLTPKGERVRWRRVAAFQKLASFGLAQALGDGRYRLTPQGRVLAKIVTGEDGA